MRFIGDIHGKIDEWIAICSETEEPTVQVGDFGIGFLDTQDSVKAMSFMNRSSENQFIRGNHDQPDQCKNIANCIDDGRTMLSKHGTKMMFIGGAASTDINDRTQGVDWWANEEVSIDRFEKLLIKYEQYKPDVMVTHDFPQDFIISEFGVLDTSRTRNYLNMMWNAHQPSLWIGGHWHVSQSRELQNSSGSTKFQILNECEYVDLAI